MASISQKIPNLLGGISQQPDPIKLPGQVVDALNVSLDPTFGCKKRPPIKFLAQLSTTIPSDAKWFPIFRDEAERYVSCVYQNGDGTASLKVWNADTGVEQTVTSYGSALDYLVASSNQSIHPLTINDYTMIGNSEKVVTMSGAEEDTTAEALLIINEVGYNTTYAVDFVKSDNNQRVKRYRAKKLAISPGSFEVTGDNGACSLTGNESFVKSGSNGQAGLGFSIVSNCQPTLVTTHVPGVYYPTAVTASGTGNFGDPNSYGAGSYLYADINGSTSAGSISVRVEVRVNGSNESNNSFAYSSASVTSYTTSGSSNWRTGMGFSSSGFSVSVTNVQQGESGENYSYKSSYTTEVRLNSPGSDWRVGDSVTAEINSGTANAKTFTITVEEETFGYGHVLEDTVSILTPVDSNDGTLDIQTIIDDLVLEIEAIGTAGGGTAKYSTETIGNVIKLTRTDSGDFNLQTRGGTTNNAIYAVKGEVSDISKLPAQCLSGTTLKIRNTAEATADDYYVQFETVVGEIPGTGTWTETVKPGITTDLNFSTMPQVLIREADGTFSFRPLSKSAQIEANGGTELPEEDYIYWSPRAVGDKFTNPNPTFVGATIQDMFFYMNRLGFLSGSAVIMSQPGDYYNFFNGSAIAASDADPIDLTASSTKPSTLKRALGTSKGLLLFAENAQFLLGTSDIAFGPSTVKITEISNYAYTSSVAPLESGISIMFSTEAETYSKVFEMAIDSIDSRPLVAENTRIIPELIPPDLKIATSSPNNSFVCFGRGDNELFVFKFFNEGNNRTIAGWSRWLFPGDIGLFEFTHDTGFVVTYNTETTSYSLGKLEFLDDPDTAPISIFGRRFVPRMDNYLYDSDVTVTVETATTKRIAFPAGFYHTGYKVYLLDASQGNSIQYFEFDVQVSSGVYYIVVPNRLVATSFLVGLGYEMQVKLPSFYVTQDKRSDRKNVPVVENVYIDMHLSGSLSVLLERVGYDDRTVQIEQPSGDIYLANAPAIVEVDTKPIPVYCRGSQSSLTITASSPLPVSLSSYSWEGHYNNRGIQSLS